jgi:hypothetical protein
MREIRRNVAKERTKAKAAITAVAKTANPARAASAIGSSRSHVALAIAAALII